MKKNLIQILLASIIVVSSSSFSFGGNKAQIKILIDNFENRSIQKQNSDEWLSQVLPYSLMKQLDNGQYDIVMMDSDFGVKKTYGKNLQSLDPKIIRSKKINYRIIGYYEVNEYQAVRITARLIKYNENGSVAHKFPEMKKWSESTRNFDRALMEFSKEIKKLIQQKGSGHEHHKDIGFFCYKQLSNLDQKIDSLLGEDLASALYYEFKSMNRDDIHILSWGESKKHCNQAITSSIVNQLKMDAYVTGQVQYMDSLNIVKVQSSLVIKELDDPILLPVINGDVKYYYGIEKQLIEQVSTFISVAIDENGEWRMEFLKSVMNSDVKALLQSATKFYKDKEYAQAELVLSMTQHAESNNVEVLTLMAKISMKNGRIKELEERCDAILVLAPNSLWALQIRGEIHNYYKEHKLALDAFNKVLANDSNNALVHYHLGTTYYDLEKYALAIDQFKLQLKTDTLTIETTNLLAISYYFESEKPGQADLEKHSLELLINMAASDPSETTKEKAANILSALGSESSNKGNYKNALNYFVAAKDIDATYDNYELTRYTLIELKSFDQLDALLKEGVDNNVWTDSVYYVTGNDLRYAKDSTTGTYHIPSLNQADSYLNKYIENHPNSAIAYKTRGSINFRLKDKEKALKYYGTALEKDSVSKETLWILLDIAEVSIMFGEQKSAIKYLDRINESLLSKDPKKKEIIRSLKIYLEIVAYTLDKKDEKTVALEASLNNYFETVFIEGWGYNTLKNWLKITRSLSTKRRNKLLQLTKTMEEHSYIN